MKIIATNGAICFTFDVSIDTSSLPNIRDTIENKKCFTRLKIVVLEKLPEHKQDETLAALAEIEKDIENFTFELVV